MALALHFDHRLHAVVQYMNEDEVRQLAFTFVSKLRAIDGRDGKNTNVLAACVYNRSCSRAGQGWHSSPDWKKTGVDLQPLERHHWNFAGGGDKMDGR